MVWLVDVHHSQYRAKRQPHMRLCGFFTLPHTIRLIDERPWYSVREALHGARVVVLTNRKGKELKNQLESLMGVPIQWCVINRNSTKLSSIESTIAKGHYDVVIGFTGWIQHNTDRVCSRAARRGGAVYIRGHKGTPAMLLQAIHRDLGL